MKSTPGLEITQIAKVPCAFDVLPLSQSSNTNFSQKCPFSEENCCVPSRTKLKACCTIMYRPGISSLRGQGHFHFEKGNSIGKSYSLWECLKGHQGQDKGNGGRGLRGLRGLREIPGLNVYRWQCAPGRQLISQVSKKTWRQAFDFNCFVYVIHFHFKSHWKVASSQ